jgi:hypothetical protein
VALKIIESVRDSHKQISKDRAMIGGIDLICYILKWLEFEVDFPVFLISEERIVALLHLGAYSSALNLRRKDEISSRKRTQK